MVPKMGDSGSNLIWRCDRILFDDAEPAALVQLYIAAVADCNLQYCNHQSLFYGEDYECCASGNVYGSYGDISAWDDYFWRS